MSHSPDFDPTKRALISSLINRRQKSSEPSNTPSSDSIGNHTMSRRGFAKAAAVGAGVLATSELVDPNAVISGIGNLFKGAELRVDFNDVWDEVEAFLNPPTDQELQQMAYNPNGQITLTLDQLKNVLIVADGDSMNLAFGIRKNSKGPNQPGSWVAKTTDNLKNAASLLGVSDTIRSANYSEPGAAGGLDDYEYPTGNVQLGATDVRDMKDDHPGEIPPRLAMLNHDGPVIATVGMNGDHLREAMDKMLTYMQSDKAFMKFCKNPSLDKIDNHIKAVLRDVLTTYKKNIQEFTADFQNALSIYQDISEKRVKAGKAPLILVSTLPINYKYAKNVPYQPIKDDGQRKSGGYLSLDAFPKAKNAALRLTSSFYQTINPLLKNFHEQTDIQVATLPMLDLSKNQSLFAQDGHFNDKGEATLGNMFTQLFTVVDDSGQKLLAFNKDGTANQLAA